MSITELELLAPPGIPLISRDADLADLILKAIEGMGRQLSSGDIVVVAQKIVSKAEGRYVNLCDVDPSPRAKRLAARTHKDARFVELVLSESNEILRERPGLLVVVHRLGIVLANAGIDYSNVSDDGDTSRVLLLPVDPDSSSQRLRNDFRRLSGVDVGVIINDSLGRAWRNGTVGVALGAAGINPLADLRSRVDLFGRPLNVTQVAVADELAAAASLLQGQADEGRPAVIIKGWATDEMEQGAASLVRPETEDMFR